MMDRLENIDELFRSGLNDYAPSPPPEVWGRIEADIVKSRKKVVVIPVFLKIAAGIVLIASITWLVWRSVNPASQEKILSETIQSIPSDKKSSTETLTKNEIRTSSIPASSAIAPEKELLTSAETSRPEVTEEIENIFKEPEVMAEPQELFATYNIIPFRNSRDILINSYSGDNNSPLIKTRVLEIDSNELIIQQNLLALADQNNMDRKKGPEWTIGGQVGPQYTYRNVYVNTPAYPVNNYDKYESGLLAYSGGLQFEVEPTRRLSIQSGVYYSKIGTTKSSLQTNPDIGDTYPYTINITDPPQRGSENMPDVVNSTGTITFDKNLTPPLANVDENINWTIGLITAEQYFEFVEVPFILRYLIIDRKLDINLCSGLWANFLVGNKATATDNETFTTEGETAEINSFSYSGSISVGLEYPVAHNIDISLEPFFKYYLSPINSNPETNVYPYSIGVLTGISYSF